MRQRDGLRQVHGDGLGARVADAVEAQIDCGEGTLGEAMPQYLKEREDLVVGDAFAALNVHPRQGQLIHGCGFGNLGQPFHTPMHCLLWHCAHFALHVARAFKNTWRA